MNTPTPLRASARQAVALLPCPFCGGEAHAVDLAGWEVLCECGVSFTPGRQEPTRELTIAAWNRRSLPDSVPAEGAVGDGWIPAEITMSVALSPHYVDGWNDAVRLVRQEYANPQNRDAIDTIMECEFVLALDPNGDEEIPCHIGVASDDAKGNRRALVIAGTQDAPVPLYAQAPAHAGWLPIESAPRDGAVVLVWDGRQAFSGWWGRTDHLNAPAWIGGHCRINHIDQPTHWQPLPQAPAALQSPATKEDDDGNP